MNNNQNQPGEFDAVLGGEAQNPNYAVVLGGIEGVKNSLSSPVLEVRIAALNEALKYGDAGLDLVRQALQDKSKLVRRYAYILLNERLRGEALLEKLESLLHLPHSERAKQCGYYSIFVTSDGQPKTQLNISEFYDAILVAKKERSLRDATLKLTPSIHHQPQEINPILGINATSPMTNVVLGGIEAMKNHMKTTTIETRVAAIYDALNYGTTGLDLVIAGLQDSSAQVRSAAYKLLQNTSDLKTKNALSNFDRLQLFTRLQDWQSDKFNPKLGIINPTSNVYVLKSLEQLQSLQQLPQVSQLQVLISQLNAAQFSYDKKFRYIVDIFFDIHEYLSGIKAVCIDPNISRSPIGDVAAILKIYPYLDLLQIGNVYQLDFSPIRHNNLKTLIVDSVDLNSRILQQIYKLELPALEYLDLGFITSNSTLPKATELMPIFSGNLFPNLKYLGIRGGTDYNEIATLLTRSALAHRLIGLDLSDGNLGGKGAEALLNCPAINHLQILNVSQNRLGKNMVQRLSKLKCQVNAKSQKPYHRYYPTWE